MRVRSSEAPFYTHTHTHTNHHTHHSARAHTMWLRVLFVLLRVRIYPKLALQLGPGHVAAVFHKFGKHLLARRLRCLVPSPEIVAQLAGRRRCRVSRMPHP